jgi:hypothetical protein
VARRLAGCRGPFELWVATQIQQARQDHSTGGVDRHTLGHSGLDSLTTTAGFLRRCATPQDFVGFVRCRVSASEASLADGQGPLMQGPGTMEIALVVQDASKTVEALAGLEVVRAQAGLSDRQSSLTQGLGSVKVTLFPQDAREVVEAVGDLVVVGAQTGLADRKAAFAQAAGAVEVALGGQDGGEVVEAPGGVGVVGA